MRGFTLIELILVIAISVIVAGLSIPFLQSFGVSTDTRTHALTINRTLRRAQQQAMSGQVDASWGVYFDTTGNEIILYQGDNYVARDTDYDQSTILEGGLTLSNTFGDDINFAVYSGTPSVSGTATITSQNNEVFIISVTSLGIIQVDE